MNRFNTHNRFCKITYINEAGLPGEIVMKDPSEIDHIWYSHKRDSSGKFEKHEVTRFGTFMARLKKCKEVKVVFSDCSK